MKLIKHLDDLEGTKVYSGTRVIKGWTIMNNGTR